MSLLKDLPELINANVISADTAEKISAFYRKKEVPSPNRQLLLFSILGALLVGTGVMFIVANQWDELPQSVKTCCAFMLLIVPQLLCGYVLLKKQNKLIWRESSALLLFFAVGANISLVSQIFNINGEMSSFTLTWMLLTVPLIYLLDVSALSLAYLFGTMVYGITARFNAPYPIEEYLFWFLFLLPLPRYIQHLKKSPENLLFILHHWMIPFVLIQTLGTLSHGSKMLLYPAYLTMFGIFYFIGNSSFFRNRPLIQNGYLLLGFAGTVIVLLIMTFKPIWTSFAEPHYQFNDLIVMPEFIACVILFTLASILLYRQNKNKPLTDWRLIDVVYILFLIIFILGAGATSLAIILVNLLIFALGLLMLREGVNLSHLGVLNIGMLVIALLVICRSFDTDLTFVVKGILFVLVGIGFFGSNLMMIKKRKKNEA